MNIFRRAFDKIRETFGRERDEKPSPWVRRRHRIDQGPATQKYVRRLFPRGVFTKRLTPAREQQIRDVFKRLRPEQKQIAYRHGYDKGLNV